MSDNSRNENGSNLLQVSNLKKHFPVSGGFIKRSRSFLRAVDGVSFIIREGETYGLVGESGCGKTTTAKMVLLLEEPTDGGIQFEDLDALNLDREGTRLYKSSIQAVFQDPWASLNPRMRVRDIIGEPLEINTTMTREKIRGRVSEVLEEVGLQAYHANLYPHEFSGGQRQRIAMARALALNPKVVVLDEPVSGLDVSIRAQIMNLLNQHK